MHKQLAKPNFLVLGAQRSGTTSLCNYLNQHPDVYISEPKEPLYFERTEEHSQGLSFYSRKYFRGWDHQQAIGDGNPNNLYLPHVPQLVRYALPEAHLIVILRNPVDRAYSHWWMRCSSGTEKLDFASALKKYPGYLERGYFSLQIRRYMELYPKPQIKLVFFQDLVNDPLSMVRELWDFIGVDSSYQLKSTRPRNAAWGNTKIASLIRLTLKYQIQRLAPEILRSSVRSAIGTISKPPEIDSEVRSWLLRHYEPYNRELESIAGRNLSEWDS